MDAGQLVLLFSDNFNMGNRIAFIKDYLHRHEYIRKGLSITVHPDYVLLFSMWENYINSEKESNDYDKLKAKIIELWGEANFYDLLNHTYFVHRNKYLLKHKLPLYFPIGGDWENS